MTQIKAIDADTWSQMKALHEDTSIAGADKRAKMMRHSQSLAGQDPRAC